MITYILLIPQGIVAVLLIAENYRLRQVTERNRQLDRELYHLEKARQ